MSRILLACILLCISSARLWGQSPPLPEVSLDRTAFFVGEPIRYQVSIRHDPQVEFVLDRLDKASLEMAPFIVQDLAVEQRRRGPQHLLTITMRLVTYEIVQKAWRIPPFNLYYASHGSPAPAEGRMVQRLTVPAVPVAFRSSLPDGNSHIRTEIAFTTFTGAFWTLLSAGLLGLVVIGGRGAALVYQRLHRPAPQREERSAIDSIAAEAVDRLLAAHQGEEETAASTTAFYRDMAALLREYTGKVSDTRGPSLTSLEVRETLVRAGEPEARARRVAELVALADHVRYTDDGAPLGRDRMAGVRSELKQLFGS